MLNKCTLDHLLLSDSKKPRVLQRYLTPGARVYTTAKIVNTRLPLCVQREALYIAPAGPTRFPHSEHLNYELEL